MPTAASGAAKPPDPLPRVVRNDRAVPGSCPRPAGTSLQAVPPPLSFDPIAEARRQWDEHWGSAATAEMAAVTSIMRAHQIVMSRLNGLLEPLDLTFPRYEALMLLYYSRKGEP